MREREVGAYVRSLNRSVTCAGAIRVVSRPPRTPTRATPPSFRRGGRPPRLDADSR
jgi:hypothetical protein